jgi:hypothetical protein
VLAEMPLQYVKSSWGKELLIIDNYTFRREKVIKEKVI